MTMNNLMTQIMISISEVMETMFYIPVEPREEQSTINDLSVSELREMLIATITFQGAFSGSIILMIPENLLMIMTENFLGENRKDLTPEHLDGTLKETLNMLAGNTFSKIEADSSFCLGVPELNTPSIISSISKGRSNMTIPLLTVDTMDGQMWIAIRLNQI